MKSQISEDVTKFVHTAFLALNSPSLGVKTFSTLLVQGGCLQMGDLFSALRGTKEVQSVLAPAVS